MSQMMTKEEKVYQTRRVLDAAGKAISLPDANFDACYTFNGMLSQPEVSIRIELRGDAAEAFNRSVRKVANEPKGNAAKHAADDLINLAALQYGLAAIINNAKLLEKVLGGEANG
jgi:hypothetical protein